MREQLHYHESYRAHTHGFGARSLHSFMTLRIPLAITAATLAISWMSWSTDRLSRRDVAVMATSLAGATIAVFASNRYYLHYFLLLLPSLAMLAVAALAKADAKARRNATLCVLVLSLFILVSASRDIYHRLVGLDTSQLEPVAAASRGGTTFEAQAAAIAIRTSHVDQRIFVFDESPAIYFLAHRESANRYIFLTHYLPEPDGGKIMIEARTLLAQVITAHPTVIFIGHLLPTDFDAEMLVKAAGYRPIAYLTDGKRSMIAYSRSGQLIAR